jgi:RecJ-like exonuclease
MTNKYPGKCIECREPVAKGAGECRKSKRGRWYVLCSEHAGRGKMPYNGCTTCSGAGVLYGGRNCPTCDGTGSATVQAYGGSRYRSGRDRIIDADAHAASVLTTFAGDAEVFTNRNGRCEDAPCCGCCT